MRKSIKKFIKICVEFLPFSEPIYEFGSLQTPGQKVIADLRPLFAGKKYIGADMREGPGVDVILNLHDINLPSESAGAVLILDTLEHVEFPRKAIKEIHRILKPDGILIMSSVMYFPIHNHPSDYWRFTPEAFRSLLEPFALSFVDFAGEKSFPHTVVGIGFKASIPKNTMNEFAKRLKRARPLRGGWKELATLFASPIVWSIYRKIRGLKLFFQILFCCLVFRIQL